MQTENKDPNMGGRIPHSVWFPGQAPHCRPRKRLGQTEREGKRASGQRVGGGGEKQRLINISDHEENYVQMCWLVCGER